MRETERKEARHWLRKLTSQHKQAKVVISGITNLETESTAQDWTNVFSNDNVLLLVKAIDFARELPKPEQKELRKLRDLYIDLVATCQKAGNLYLKSYYDGDLSRFKYSQMIYWTGFANGLLKSFSRHLDKVCQQIEED